jgi:hypothetical protein
MTGATIRSDKKPDCSERAAANKGVRYRAIVGTDTWPARAMDVVVIGRGYGATAAIAFAAVRRPGGLLGEERQSAA